MADDTKSKSISHRSHVGRRPTDARNITWRAFTLTELTAVLLLISILTVVAAPKWTASLQQLRVSNAANRIVADLARAQSAAYSSSASKTITFTVSSSQYTVSGTTSLNLGAAPYVVDLTVDPFKSTLVSVWGQTSTQTLTFNGFGLPGRGGNIVVSCGGLQKTIVVDANSGSAVAK